MQLGNFMIETQSKNTFKSNVGRREEGLFVCVCVCVCVCFMYLFCYAFETILRFFYYIPEIISRYSHKVWDYALCDVI